MEMTFDPYMPPLLCGTVKFSLPVAVCSQFFETPSRKCFPPQILTSFVCVSLICLLSSKKHVQKQEEGVKEAIRLNGGWGIRVNSEAETRAVCTYSYITSGYEQG